MYYLTAGLICESTRQEFPLLISGFKNAAECRNVLSNYNNTPEKDINVPVIFTIGNVAFLDSRFFVIYNLSFLPMVPISYLQKDSEGDSFIKLSYKSVRSETVTFPFSRSSELDTQYEILSFILNLGGKGNA